MPHTIQARKKKKKPRCNKRCCEILRRVFSEEEDIDIAVDVSGKPTPKRRRLAAEFALVLEHNSPDELYRRSQEHMAVEDAGFVVQRALDVVTHEERAHPGSPLLAKAYYYASECCWSAGMNKRSLLLLRKAARIKPIDLDSRRCQVVYLVEYGRWLPAIGVDAAIAERHLRRGAEKREQLTGVHNSTYVHTLLLLAENLLIQRKVREAQEETNKALKYAVEVSETRAGEAMGLRTLVYKYENKKAVTLDGWDKLSTQMRESAVNNLTSMWNSNLGYFSGKNEKIAHAMLHAMKEVADQSLDGLSLRVRLKAFQVAYDIAEEQDVARMRIYFAKMLTKLEMLTIGYRLKTGSFERLATAYEHAGKLKEAEAAFEAGLRIAERSELHEQIAETCLDYGHFCMNIRNHKKGVPLLDRCVVEGNKALREDLVGRALAYLGVYLFHYREQDSEQGKELLRGAIKLLPKDSLVYDYAKRHLEAYEDNRSCSCVAASWTWPQSSEDNLSSPHASVKGSPVALTNSACQANKSRSRENSGSAKKTGEPLEPFTEGPASLTFQRKKKRFPPRDTAHR